MLVGDDYIEEKSAANAAVRGEVLPRQVGEGSFPF